MRQMKQVAASSFTFVEPMKALPVRDLPTGNWLYEIKFDGYRALAFKTVLEVRLVSRNRIDFGDDYPPLLDAVKSLRAKNFTIAVLFVTSTQADHVFAVEGLPDG